MKASDVYAFTAVKLARLLNMKNEGQQKAQLAELRRGVGKQPGDLPQLWGSLLEGMSEEMLGASGSASYAEWSVYTVLTLFALHQQGHDVLRERMHVSPEDGRGVSIGAAAAQLVHSADEQERILRRFHQAATATEREEVAHHLRGLVQLLKQEGIALDYALLAKDLYLYQYPENQTAVRLRWGEDFYRTLNHNQESEEENDA